MLLLLFAVSIIVNFVALTQKWRTRFGNVSNELDSLMTLNLLTEYAQHSSPAPTPTFINTNAITTALTPHTWLSGAHIGRGVGLWRQGMV
jgi:hypothetical protein